MFYSLANKHDVRVGGVESDAKVRVMFHPSIVSANQDLIEHGFPWADGFITKPSGDMAYDAVASGCFLLTLSPWGEWEENIEKIFSNLNISQKADVENFSDQIINLLGSGWIEKAINNALKIDEIFLKGAKNIVDLQQKLS